MSSRIYQAQSARCFTTDDGECDCIFVATDTYGGFEIGAPDKPKFSLVISEPGADWHNSR